MPCVLGGGCVESRYELAARRHEFDRTTGPYPYDSYGAWQALTRHVDSGVLSRHRVTLGRSIAVRFPSGHINTQAWH